MKSSDVFNLAYPIVGISIYPNGVLRVKRKSDLQGKFTYDAGRKDRPIVKFTNKSMARLVATANATEVEFKSMLTLTYPSLFPLAGTTIKQDMNRFLTMVRDKGWGDYLWFLEFQKRGAPHFHILMSTPAITARMRITVAETWVGRMARSDWLVGQAITKAALADKCEWKVMSDVLSKAYFFTFRPETWELLRSEDGGRKYATKYAVKERQKIPPEQFEGVGRFWGCSKRVNLGEGVYREMDETRLRNYLESTAHATAEWEVLPKYLFSVDQEMPVDAVQV